MKAAVDSDVSPISTSVTVVSDRNPFCRRRPVNHCGVISEELTIKIPSIIKLSRETCKVSSAVATGYIVFSFMNALLHNQVD